jgi:predicted branched-subunit amino acid permease
MSKTEKIKAYREGMRDGVPIGLGYFAVAFSLGIAARSAGMSALQGLVASLLCNASAGEFALFTVIGAGGTYLEVALVTLIANARYLLMSTALSQKFNPKTPLIHRFFVGYGITDELFGLGIGEPGWLSPWYYYGALGISALFWALGSAGGIIAGNILPARIVRALSVALFGMFLAIIIPPAKHDKAVAAVVASGFSLSFLFDRLPFIHVSSGTKTIILTILIAGVASWLAPHTESGGDQA